MSASQFVKNLPFDLPESQAMSSMPCDWDPLSVDSEHIPLVCHLALRGWSLILETAIARGADPDARMFGIRSMGKSSPLHLAKNPETALVLLSHGAIPDIRDRYGATPLLRAIYDGRTEVAETIIGFHPASVTICDTERQTPLSAAACLGFDTIVRTILEMGHDPADRRHDLTDPCEFDANPFTLASRLDHAPCDRPPPPKRREAFSLLVNAGFLPTPHSFHVAAQFGNEWIIEDMLSVCEHLLSAESLTIARDSPLGTRRYSHLFDPVIERRLLDLSAPPATRPPKPGSV